MSFIETKLVAIAEAFKELTWIKKVLTELGFVKVKQVLFSFVF